MRIISGSRRGKKLFSPEGEATRPTLERVKQAVFSALQFELENRRALDLFAGSGHLGLEALSRGAAECWFNDANPSAINVVRRNIQACGFEKMAKDTCRDWSVCVKMLKEVGYCPDLVFLDPPYRAGLVEKSLAELAPILAPGAVVVAETGADETFDYAGLDLRKEYGYGTVRVTLLEKRKTE